MSAEQRTGTAPDLETVRFPVHGMTCMSCVNRITRSLKKMDGVSKVKVDLANETATVTRVRGRVSDTALSVAVAEAGYEADVSSSTPMPTELNRGFLGRLFGKS